MRALLILCSIAATAHADDGFDWDQPRPRTWELTASTIVHGQPEKVPSAGLVLSFEHRLDNRLWAGFAGGAMAGRQMDDHLEPLPLQKTMFVAATTRLVLGHWVDALDGDEIIEAGIRAELGNAIVSHAGMRATPILAGGAFYGRIGKERTSFMMSLGWGVALASNRDWLNLGGIDVRMAVVRNW